MEAMERIIEDATVELIRRAVTRLPADVVMALESADKTETNAAARRELGIMIENVREAGRCTLPMCQDTGIPVFFVKMGRRHVAGLEDALARAVRRATIEVPLRRNVVDPLTRVNSGDNTGVRMPYISYSFSDAGFVEIAFMPKGAGSENMSALAMLNPSDGVAGVKKFVVDAIVRAEGKPCPPVIVGVGIGGSADACLALAKKALMRPVGSRNPVAAYASLEAELLQQINATGIGPMGLGGKTTALAVHVEQADCHTASLPVGINLQCYAARRASMKVYDDGHVEYGGV
jgi:fumarate hydratase subunit alpha